MTSTKQAVSNTKSALEAVRLPSDSLVFQTKPKAHSGRSRWLWRAGGVRERLIAEVRRRFAPGSCPGVQSKIQKPKYPKSKISYAPWVFVLLCVFLVPRPLGARTGAVLTLPANGAANVDPFQVFTWAAVPGASAYVLWIGTTPGDWDAYHSGYLFAQHVQPWGLLPGTTY